MNHFSNDNDTKEQNNFNDFQREEAKEILQHLINSEKALPINSQYINEVQTGIFSSDMRFILLKWLYTEIGVKYQLNTNTIQKAFIYIDVFLSYQQTNADSLQLIGSAAIHLAISIEETRGQCFLTKELLLAESLNIFSSEELIKCENAILDALKWKAIIPAPSEILKQILYLANPFQDFSEIINKTNKLIFQSMFSYQMLSNPASSHAFYCLLMVLENLDYHNFKNGIIELLEECDLILNEAKFLIYKEDLKIIQEQQFEINEQIDQQTLDSLVCLDYDHQYNYECTSNILQDSFNSEFFNQEWQGAISTESESIQSRIFNEEKCLFLEKKNSSNFITSNFDMNFFDINLAPTRIQTEEEKDGNSEEIQQTKLSIKKSIKTSNSILKTYRKYKTIQNKDRKQKKKTFCLSQKFSVEENKQF